MGLFDVFKKKEKNIQNDDIADIDEQQKDYYIQYGVTRDGRLKVELYEAKQKLGQFYDTTRLIVDKYPVIMENQVVQNCMVSWYGREDCVLLDGCEPGEAESLRAKQYQNVLAQIDFQMLQTDEEYCYTVMNKLLDRKRVAGYLEEGLRERPERVCGNYIGGVRKTEEGYGKFFNPKIGEASHNSELMVNRRKEYREKNEAKRQGAIAAKRAQIEQLQNEIDEMSR